MDIFDLIVGTPSRNALILRAYNLKNADKNPWKNALSIIDDVSGKLKSKKSSVETSFDFDTNSVVENIGNILKQGGKYAEDTLESSNVILDYLHTGGKINENDLKATWILPLPNNLLNAISHSYSEDTSGIDKIVDKANFSNPSNKSDSVIKKLSNFASEKIMSSSIGLAKTAKRFNMNIDQKIITTYTDTEIRSFNFEFNFTPFSRKNSEEIFKGILNLKKFMTGNIMDDSLSMFLQQPTVFTVEFASRDNDDNFNTKIKEVFGSLLLLNNNMELNLSSMRTSYLGEKHPIIDGLPKTFTMNIVLTERRPYRRDFYDKGANK